MSQDPLEKPVSSAGTGFAPDEPTLGSGPLVPEINVGAPDEFATPKGQSLRGRLQRVTSSGRFIPEVDGLRFIALLSVLLFHVSTQIIFKSSQPIEFSAASRTFHSILDRGELGVQLFFAISGFILALPFAACYLKAGKPVCLRAYYLRRLTRLEPPYIITLVLFAILMVVVLKIPVTEIIPHFFASAFYVHNLFYAYISSINNVAWSLEVEVQFYLLAPFLALLFQVRPALLRRALLVGLSLCFIALQSFWPESERLRLSILGQGQFFLIGFLLADFYLMRWIDAEVHTNYKPKMWDVLFFAGLAIIFLIPKEFILARWLIPLLVFSIYAAAFQGNWCRRFLSFSVVTIIGGMCYSIYLIHFQIIALVWRASSRLRLGDDFVPNFIMQFVLMVPVILLISAIFYLIVEKPCMSRDWPTRLANRAKLRKTTENV